MSVESETIRQFAFEEPECNEALEEFARNLFNASTPEQRQSAEAWFMDRIRAILNRTHKRIERQAEDDRYYGEGLNGDEHERGFVA